MSSFELSDESTALISKFIYVQTFEGSRNVISFYRDLENSLRYEMEKGLNISKKPNYSVTEKDIFILLKKLNIEAVNGRYKKSEEFNIDDLKIPEFEDFPSIDDFEFDGKIQKATAQHWQILKSLDCYIYQCEEDVTRNSTLLKTVKFIRDCLKNFLIHNLPEYDNAIWG